METAWLAIVVVVGGLALAGVFLFATATSSAALPTEPQLTRFERYSSPCPYYTIELYNPLPEDLRVDVSVEFSLGGSFAHEEPAFAYYPGEPYTTLVGKEHTQLKTGCVANNIADDPSLETRVLIR